MSESINRNYRSQRDRIAISLMLLMFLPSAARSSRADRITLRGGGQIHGKLIPDKANPDRLTFVGEVGKNPIIYKKDQILQVSPEKSSLDDYVVLRARDRTVAEDEYQLAVWCEDHKLQDLAANHYEAAVKLDPQYGPAHEKLGHVLLNERWLNADELREAQGQVKFRGRWMTPEEKERLEDQAALVAENQSWLRRVKALRDGYASGVDARSKEAEKRLLAIREVAAVGPVSRVLGSDANATIRSLTGRVLGSIPGTEASAALVARLLNEADPWVRETTLSEVAKRDPEEVVPRLVRALRSSRSDIINRAAWSLAQLNARTAVPQLIPVLSSTEYQTVMVPSGGGGYAGNGGVAAGVNPNAPAGGVGFSNYTGGTYLGITPPAVAPGVVAFGATGVPYGSGISLGSGGGIGISGGGVGLGGGSTGPVARVVAIDHPNVEVLAALVKLTGQDYGYDVTTWKRWAASSFRSDPTPARRVPQP